MRTKMNTSLRSYQKDIKKRIFEAWKSHQSVMMQMPTGTGKTQVLASVVNEELRMENEGCRVWVIAHRRELVEQIEETVARYGIREEPGMIKVMSIQWLSLHWEDMKDERPGLIVIDEAHHALAETYRELWIRYPKAKKLGMTATPCRLNRKGFTDLFEVLIVSESIAEFIREGWLSVFDYVSIRLNSKDQQLVNSLSKRGADGDFQVKEMNEVLNCRPSIKRLYECVRQYAPEKKGIVYAISISHARNIASYYSSKGINAVAIDSKTPARLRKQLVEDFKRGKIQVLVNVDVFSEGFDCPDVEFVQMARPTLSLAKYLQQVGRGLRKTEGKETCIMIDNVGLYRLFGLPTAYRNWQAMFDGRLAGKGYSTASARTNAYTTVSQELNETANENEPLETIISHEHLLNYLQNVSAEKSTAQPPEELKPFKDRQNGLWGLRQGQTVTVPAKYRKVFDIKNNLAAVKFNSYHTGIVDRNGNIQLRLDQCQHIKFLPNNIVSITDNSNRTYYIDLKNNHLYNEKPKVLKFGGIELLKVNDIYYTRTKRVYKSHFGMSDFDIIPQSFYLRIHDKSPNKYEFKHVDDIDLFLKQNYICILTNDEDNYYGFCGKLADGSIIIVDKKGNYYHAEEGKEKQYIACEHPQTQEESFDVVIPRLKAEAQIHAEKIQEIHLRKEKQKRKERLNSLQHAIPFQAGLKWGLKSGNRIVVPPIYRSIQAPVAIIAYSKGILTIGESSCWTDRL